MRNQQNTETNSSKPLLPKGPALHPEDMRNRKMRPSQAMEEVVAAKTPTALSFKELANAVWEVDTNKPGPRLVLMGGTHGNEPSGVFAVMRLLHEFAQGARELECGKVVFAVGNEEAVLKNSRQVDYNLNRLFLPEPKEADNYELSRVRELQRVLFETGSFLVDLHSTSQASRPFVMVETSRVDETCWIPADTVLCGKPDYWDRYLSGTTQCYGRLKGVPAFTVECGQHDEQSTEDMAYNTACAFLEAYRAGPPQESKRTGGLVVEFSAVIRKDEANFEFARRFAGFDELNKGEEIGRGPLVEHTAATDCVMVFPTDPTKVNLGDDLYFLGLKLP
jgi:succinylglutamate desuccinylase